jgi:hypothetical protein
MYHYRRGCGCVLQALASYSLFKSGHRTTVGPAWRARPEGVEAIDASIEPTDAKDQPGENIVDTSQNISPSNRSLSEIIMKSSFTNHGLFHRRRPGRQNDVDPALLPALRGEAFPRNTDAGFSRRAVVMTVLASTAICATIGVILFVI